jgi:hypothetical protein
MRVEETRLMFQQIVDILPAKMEQDEDEEIKEENEYDASFHNELESVSIM